MTKIINSKSWQQRNLVMNEWIDKQIEDFFEYTTAGDWGIEPSLNDATAIIGTANFRNDGKIDFGNTAFRKIEKSRLEKRQINKGDILFEKSGGSTDQLAGRVVYCDIDFGGTCSNFVEVAKVKRAFDSRFIFYLLFYLYRTGRVAKYQQQTTGIINFKLNEYKKERVKLPESKLEQSAIAQVLLNIDEGIEQTEKLIAKQQRIKRGLLQDLLTKGIDEYGAIRSEATHEFKDSPLGRIPKEWEVCTFERITESAIDGPFGSNLKTEHYVSEPEVRVVRLQNIGEGFFDNTDKVYVSREHAHKLKRHQIVSGDIIVASMGDVNHPIARACLYPSDVQAGIVKADCFRVRLKKHLALNAYAKYVLNCPATREDINILGQGVTRDRINLTKLMQVRLRIPPVNEQEQIVQTLDSAQREIEQGESTQEILRRIKTGLMQDLLTGKVRVGSELTNQS
jgi:type I restriction enzyme S subunit